MCLNDFPVPAGFWDLPSCPQVAHQILQLVPFGQETIPELLDVIRWDPALSARILAAANGSHFGQQSPVLSLQRARLLLNDDAFRLLSLQFTLDSLSAERQASLPLYQAFWTHSRYRALTTKELCDGDAEQAEVNPFLASLLCDLGRLALIQSHPREARQIYEVVTQTAVPYEEVLRTRLTTGMRESQENLLYQANFPASFLKAVESRHVLDDPPEQQVSRLAEVFDVAEAMADYLYFQTENPQLAERWHDRLKTAYARFLSEDQSAASSLETLIEKVQHDFEERFSADQPDLAAEDLLRRANRELGRLGWEASLVCNQAQIRARQAETSLHQGEQKIAQLEQQALRDPLTGIYNRRFLLEASQKELARCCRYGTPIGLLFVDVDFFKNLNDTKGHLVGDLVLRKVSETLENVIRGADILARYGGEEFVVLPSNPNEKGIVQLAERMRHAVEQLITRVEGERIAVTVSVGCTLTVPKQNDLDLIPQLLASADAAMYDAKQLGRNRVVFRSMLDESERDLMQQTIDCSFSRWLVARNILRPEVIEAALMDYAPERLALGELAIDMGLLTESQVSQILDNQRLGGERFGALALQRGWLTSEQLALLLARQRENPVQVARLLIAKNLLQESYALALVHEFLNQSKTKKAKGDENSSAS